MDLFKHLLETIGQLLALSTSSRLSTPETHDISALLESQAGFTIAAHRREFSMHYRRRAWRRWRRLTRVAKRELHVCCGQFAEHRLSFLLPSKHAFEMAARSLKVEPITKPFHSDAEIEEAIIALGREPGAGLVVMGDVFMVAHRAPIISAAARNNVPAVYNQSAFLKDGGLLSYGPDYVDTFRRAATYVDRILRGAKPGDLPVQLPVKHEMAVNLKTAKALGLAVPPSMRLLADEVIE